MTKKPQVIKKLIPEKINLKWLELVEKSIRKNISNKRFGVPQLAQKLNISERQFRRRIKKDSGFSPVFYIQEIRLQMAAEYFDKEEPKSIKKICAKLGVTNRAYFQKKYFIRFGKELKDCK